MVRLLKQPLLHFLLIGMGLFALFDLTATNAEPAADTIVVDREALLTFIQFRAKAFAPGLAPARLDAMSPRQLDELIAQYVREEALHREALALGMDADDYIIKRRLVQKVEFVADGFAADVVQLDDAAIAAHYAEHQQSYFVEPLVTFTHVFFDDERGAARAEDAAAAKLVELNRAAVPFAQSTRHGDRFLYHTNYVERTREFVASHFGESMAAQVFALDGDDKRWHGPFASPHGQHLVLLASRTDGRLPELAEIAEQVASDARRARVRAASEAEIQAILARYTVDVQLAQPAPAL